MTWVRIDDRFAQHPKVVAAGPLAMAMQVAALGYCNRELTDGFIPRAIARTLMDFEVERDGKLYTLAFTCGMAGDDISAAWVIEGLVEAGMWEEVPGGYRIHDYHDYQPTKEQVLHERELTKKRVHAFRERNAVGNAVTNGASNGGVTPSPTPTASHEDIPPLVPPQGGEAKPKKKVVRAQQVPAEWLPDPPYVDWAVGEGFTHEQVTHETAKFVRHHRSKGNTFKDIGLAWQNWMENSRTFGKPRASPNGKAESLSYYDDPEEVRLAKVEMERQRKAWAS